MLSSWSASSRCHGKWKFVDIGGSRIWEVTRIRKMLFGDFFSVELGVTSPISINIYRKVLLFLWYLVRKLNITMYPPCFLSFQHAVLQAHVSVMPFPSSELNHETDNVHVETFSREKLGLFLFVFLGFAWASSKDMARYCIWLKHIFTAYHWSSHWVMFWIQNVSIWYNFLEPHSWHWKDDSKFAIWELV